MYRKLYLVRIKNENMFEDKVILITGGSGSLGRALTSRLLKEDVKNIRIFSRNEIKQIEMEHEFEDESRLRFLIGDVRDKDRLSKAMEGVDVVFHTAALKHVPIVEYNPFEAIKTNVIGTQNVIDASHKENVEIAVGIGTDKAVSPVNIYGATKLLTEKLFVSAKNYVDTKKYKTKFLAIRYGNVLGSSGSVLPKFAQQILDNKQISITHPEMTRFTITMKDALDFILNSIKNSKGSETFVPKLSAYNIMDLKDALFSILGDCEYKISKIRPGERMNEILLNKLEMTYSINNENQFVLFPPELFPSEPELKYPNFKTIDEPYEYSSDMAQKLTVDQIKALIQNSGILDTIKDRI